jgi:hypothetical protein
MAIVYSYPLYKPEGGDLLLGSKIIEGGENSLPKNLTVNYSVATLTNYIIEQYAKGIAWEFVVGENEEDERPDGSLSFELYNANVPFQDITTIKISESTSGGKYALQYIQALVGNNISVSNYLDINNFGVYKLNSLVQDPLEPTFYDANLTFVKGNGNLANTKLYYIEASAIGITGDKNFVFNQSVPSTVWSITHNLNKFPSVSVVDTANTQVFTIADYIDKNTLILTFSAAFAGKAYLN